ncbi:MAG: bifunctional UDP-N-acetylglucosamine diphosphorylase/glucosamine-1-phosphate N-acetyltransferase GlmU [Clostridioides sp.]|jgi:bifunctional UDP-N-acetylglucosamine pyrophosphorylase/glucosamine-1-phosphate N-acetyltransferase|nr:bifunctional UDP-N-acetylglucosamine diphosphorylase/glucosamine-1-phosphate N-acetyltransferase GlmU [Clostridioides sp.]
MKFKAIILAAGKGTRMKSEEPKVVHKVCGKEMINHVIDTSRSAGVDDVVVILGHGADCVNDRINSDCEIVKQKEQLGTGHAVIQAKDKIGDEDTILIICGDTPLVKSETIKNLFEHHHERGNKATVLTTVVDDPTGYGRVITTEDGELIKIVEQKDASEEEKSVREINSGIYCFSGASLKHSLESIDNDNAQGEYYLTDTIKILREEGSKVGAYKGATIDELMGVNSRVQLSQAEEIMRARINEGHMDNGVTMINPATTYIESDVQIGSDTIIYPGAMLMGSTKIGKSAIIGMNSSITNSTIGDFTEVKNSTIIDSVVGSHTTVGPYAYLRPNANVGDHVKIGDFVEIKNSNIGNNSKASHLAYIGDADVGENVNIGCGVVFVNYDGEKKFRSTVKDGAFVGSNSNLVAPVTVEEKGYIAAGSTITDDVPNASLAIARARQVVKDGWVDKNKK